MSGMDIDDLKERLGILYFALEPRILMMIRARKTLMEHFKWRLSEGLGLDDYDCGIIAAGALFQLSE